MQIIIETAKENMDSALKHLEREMLNIRAGKANPIMLSGVKVDYYGTPTVISQVANINTPDSKTLVIQPWDKSILGDVENAIMMANLRSKVFNMPFGDQCLLINRLYYESIGGYEEIDKMEDMEIMLKIPNKNKFFFKSYIETSFNKYKNNGILTQSIKNIFNQIFFLLR